MGLRVLTGSAAHLRLVYIFGEGRSNFRSAENKESPIHVYSGWFGQFMSIHVLGVFFYYFLQYFLQPEDQKRERESLCLFFPFVLRSQGRGQLELLPFDEDSDSVEIAPGARNDCG